MFETNLKIFQTQSYSLSWIAAAWQAIYSTALFVRLCAVSDSRDLDGPGSGSKCQQTICGSRAGPGPWMLRQYYAQDVF